jgi:hypothetical protein
VNELADVRDDTEVDGEVVEAWSDFDESSEGTSQAEGTGIHTPLASNCEGTPRAGFGEARNRFLKLSRLLLMREDLDLLDPRENEERSDDGVEGRDSVSDCMLNMRMFIEKDGRVLLGLEDLRLIARCVGRSAIVSSGSSGIDGKSRLPIYKSGSVGARGAGGIFRANADGR